MEQRPSGNRMERGIHAQPEPPSACGHRAEGAPGGRLGPAGKGREGGVCRVLEGRGSARNPTSRTCSATQTHPHEGPGLGPTSWHHVWQRSFSCSAVGCPSDRERVALWDGQRQ